MKLEDVANQPLQYGDRVVHVDDASMFAGQVGKIVEIKPGMALVKWESANKPVAMTLNGLKRA